MGCRVESLRIGPEKNFCYLIYAPISLPVADLVSSEPAECALVDGAYEFDKISQWISSFNTAQTKLRIKYLLATHGHLDHAGGLMEMKKRHPKAKIAAHEDERARLAKSGIELQVPLKDNEELTLGEQKIKVWHSPGHTEGGCCYLTGDPLHPKQVITGDTLFVGQCGRTDMAGGNDALLFKSLQRLKTLPGETIVRPGHDYGSRPQSTIAYEIETNPTMKAQTLAEFISLP